MQQKIKEQNNSNPRQAKINDWKNKLTAFEDHGFLDIIIKYVYEKIFLTMKIINVNIKKKIIDNSFWSERKGEITSK